MDTVYCVIAVLLRQVHNLSGSTNSNQALMHLSFRLQVKTLVTPVRMLLIVLCTANTVSPIQESIPLSIPTTIIDTGLVYVRGVLGFLRTDVFSIVRKCFLTLKGGEMQIRARIKAPDSEKATLPQCTCNSRRGSSNRSNHSLICDYSVTALYQLLDPRVTAVHLMCQLNRRV